MEDDCCKEIAKRRIVRVTRDMGVVTMGNESGQTEHNCTLNMFAIQMLYIQKGHFCFCTNVQMQMQKMLW